MILYPSLSTLVAQSGGVVSDPANDRIVRVTIIGLVVVGVVLLAVTAWFWRSTRPEPPALAPLEEMSRRTYRRLSDDEARKEWLDEVRSRVRPQPLEAHEAHEAHEAGEVVEADDQPESPSDHAASPIDPLLRP